MRNKIKDVAEAKGFSIYALAWEMGVHPPTVYAWVRGRQPTFAHLDRLCEVLGCTLNDLFEPEPIGDLRALKQKA